MRLCAAKNDEVMDMDRVLLKDLNMKNREEVLRFLKKLWDEEKTSCLVCGSELELMRKKAKEAAKVTTSSFDNSVLYY